MSSPQSNAYPSSPPSLTASSSQSTTTAVPAAYQTPTQAGKDGPIITLAKLFEDANYSQPYKSDECPLDCIVTKANEILKHHPEALAWDRLQTHNKVGLAFLVYKNQHLWLSNSKYCTHDMRAVAIEMMEKVNQIDWEQKIYCPLAAFLHKGGDGLVSLNDAEGRDYWAEFLSNHPEWGGEDAFTIFTHEGISGHRVKEPFVRFQNMNSMICFILSAAQVLLYCMIQRTGLDLMESIAYWGINVGRFMRNNLTEEQVFRTIFLKNGGYPQQILETMLTQHVTTHPDACTRRSRPISIGNKKSQILAGQIEYELKVRGALLVCGLRTFPDFEDPTKTEFGGDWDNLKDDPAGTIRHAAVVVGVMHTGDDNVMGGVKFLLQDTLPGRPFVVMGIDLLRSMGIRDFEGVEMDASFMGTTPWNNLDVGPGRISYSSSGSPHASKMSPPNDIVEPEYDVISRRLSSLSNDQDNSQEASASKTADDIKPDYIGFDDLESFRGKKFFSRT